MKPAIALFILLSLAVPQKQCNFDTTEKLRTFCEQRAQEMFPNAKAVIVPQQHAILVLTCTQGIGPQFVSKLQNYMATDAEMKQQLGTINYTEFLGYHHFLLGFDSGLIVYSIQDRTLAAIPPPDKYGKAYRQTCGLN